MLPSLAKHPHARAVLPLDAPTHPSLLPGRPGRGLPPITACGRRGGSDGAPVCERAARPEEHGVPAETARACARLPLSDGEKALALALGSGAARGAADEGFVRAGLRDDL